jgi:hypothetical protein
VTFYPVTFVPVTFFRLPFMYIISHLLEEVYENQITILLKISCSPMKRQTIICISDFW